MRQLVRDAIGGLNPGERDVIELSLVQGLDGDELADTVRSAFGTYAAAKDAMRDAVLKDVVQMPGGVSTWTPPGACFRMIASDRREIARRRNVSSAP